MTQVPYMLGPNYGELNKLVANNGFELQAQVRNILRLLRPQIAIGHSKVRFGCAGDGGYIHLDDFDGVDTAISLGIENNISWDLAIADRGLIIHQYDGTVDDPAPDDPRMIFSRTMIGAPGQPGVTTLQSIIERLDKGQVRPNLFLKMDIECGEWVALDVTSLDAISRFSQITCELHNFGGLVELPWRQAFFRCLRKLSKFYAPIHVHGNNYGGWATVANIPLPNVMEVTFANRMIYKFQDSDELFPSPLDMPCDALAPDMFLGSFRF